MSEENSVEHFAARALAVNQPAIFHVVGEAAAACHSSRSALPRAYEVYGTGRGGYHVRTLSRPEYASVAPLSRLASDPFSQGVGRSTGATSIDDAIASLQEEEELGWPIVEHDIEDVRKLGEAYQSIVAETSEEPYEIVALGLRTIAAPTQYDGVTDDGRPVYIRYRGGSFRVDIGGLRGSDGETVYSEGRGGAFDGVLSTEDLEDALSDAEDVVLSLDLSTVESPSLSDDETEQDARQAAERFSGKVEEAGVALLEAAERFEETADRVHSKLESNTEDTERDPDGIADAVEAAEGDPEKELSAELWWATNGIGVNWIERHLNELYMSHENRVAVANSFHDRLNRTYEKLEEISQQAESENVVIDIAPLYDALASLRTAADDLHSLLI